MIRIAPLIVPSQDRTASPGEARPSSRSADHIVGFTVVRPAAAPSMAASCGVSFIGAPRGTPQPMAAAFALAAAEMAFPNALYLLCEENVAECALEAAAHLRHAAARGRLMFVGTCYGGAHFGTSQAFEDALTDEGRGMMQFARRAMKVAKTEGGETMLPDTPYFRNGEGQVEGTLLRKDASEPRDARPSNPPGLYTPWKQYDSHASFYGPSFKSR